MSGLIALAQALPDEVTFNSGSIFTDEWGGNEVWRYFAYLAIVLLSIVLSKMINYSSERIVSRFTRKTRFKADDVIVKVLRRPLSVIALFSGIYLGLYLLTFKGQSIPSLSLIRHTYVLVMTVLIVYVVARLYGDLLSHYLKPVVEETETRLDDQLLPLVVKGGKMVIWALGIMIALENVDVDVAGLLAGLGIGGLALAMAAKDTISNVFGGASVFTDKPFEIGDTITVSGTTGTVEEIGVRSTRMRTFEDTIFILPNQAFIDSPVENLSRRRKRKKDIDLGLTYDTTPEQLEEAKQILAQILNDVGGIEPDPTIRFNAFGDSALIVKLIYWVSDVSGYFPKIGQVNDEILKRFNEAGLEFAFPSQTVYLKQEA